MIEKIKSLLEEKNYDKALTLIESELSQINDISSKETLFAELLHLRVFTKYSLGESDVIIRDQVRKEIFPSETYHYVENSHQIKLIYKGAFIDKCDAYVNTVYIDNPFHDLTSRSATLEFIKRIGIEEVERQLNNVTNKMKGDFILLEHKKLSAPISYHILFYSDNGTEIDLLEKGITNVMNDACNRRLREISFFPLGFDLVVKAEQIKKNMLAEELADKTAEFIVSYIMGNKNKYIPKITFNFVTVLTMLTYQKAFNKWADFKTPYFQVMKQISGKQKNIVKDALTCDTHYIEALYEITYALDDKSSILVLGETGVGKSFLSRILHKYSYRSKNPFKEMNCQQITRELIYSQLFGAKKGSFTGASRDIVGAIEAAEGGVLFLDEVGYSDLEVQRTLLKFLDNGKYSMLGDEKSEKSSDVKLVFGTNVDLEKSIDESTFAHDFYERIAGNPITIPPLRNRKNDIPLLVNYFKDDINSNSSFRIEIPKETVELLMTFNWPGNVRQLGHYIAEIFRKARSKNTIVITPDMINSKPPRNELKAKSPIRNLEKSLLQILDNWEVNDGNILDEVVKPILSKIYETDFKGKIKESSKFIGIDGTRGKNKPLSVYHDKYNEMIKKYLK